jgi:catechol 2,3-dioxygenase-like lactoylglutathione lyase family enzyme
MPAKHREGLSALARLPIVPYADSGPLGAGPGPGSVSNLGCSGMLQRMIGQLEKTVLDCPEPRALAGFYAEVLGMRINEDSADWVVIGREPDERTLAFQRASPWVPPRWPDPEQPQQLHLDIRVDDVDTAERAVLALGARRVESDSESGFRVFTDPAGHPFCLVFG